tara:strand:- start:157 stop:444 length:288 start_codon:yes stop_codon:yes gene_type:complete
MKITVVLDGKPLLTDLPENGVLRGFFYSRAKGLASLPWPCLAFSHSGMMGRQKPFALSALGQRFCSQVRLIKRQMSHNRKAGMNSIEIAYWHSLM